MHACAATFGVAPPFEPTGSADRAIEAWRADHCNIALSGPRLPGKAEYCIPPFAFVTALKAQHTEIFSRTEALDAMHRLSAVVLLTTSHQRSYCACSALSSVSALSTLLVRLFLVVLLQALREQCPARIAPFVYTRRPWLTVAITTCRTVWQRNWQATPNI
jgi:hypothetical protein